MVSTLFERIINREIPATFEFEDDLCVAIRDVAPAAPLHILIIPRTPIRGIDGMTDDHEQLVGHLMNVGRMLAERHGVHSTGYRLVTNVGNHGGQTVPHLHVHLLAGEPLGAMRTTQGGQGGGQGGRVTAAGGSGLLRDAGILLVLGITLAALFNAANPKSIPWLKPTYERVAMTDAELQALLGSKPAEEYRPAASVDTEQPSTATTPAATTPVATTPVATTPATTSLKPEIKDAPTRGEKPVATAAAADAAPKATPAPPTFQPQPGVVREIGYDAFVKIIEGPHYLIDARTAKAYSQGHIAGAVNYYGGEVQKHIPAMLASVPRDRAIVIYCDGGPECELSHHVADALKGFGFGPMLIYMGGWEEWEKRGRK